MGGRGGGGEGGGTVLLVMGREGAVSSSNERSMKMKCIMPGNVMEKVVGS